MRAAENGGKMLKEKALILTLISLSHIPNTMNLYYGSFTIALVPSSPGASCCLLLRFDPGTKSESPLAPKEPFIRSQVRERDQD